MKYSQFDQIFITSWYLLFPATIQNERECKNTACWTRAAVLTCGHSQPTQPPPTPSHPPHLWAGSLPPGCPSVSSHHPHRWQTNDWREIHTTSCVPDRPESPVWGRIGWLRSQTEMKICWRFSEVQMGQNKDWTIPRLRWFIICSFVHSW